MVRRVGGIMCKARVKAVALHVGLINQVETMQCCQFIPGWIIGIVTAANCVHVCRLEQHDITQHVMFVYYMPCVP